MSKIVTRIWVLAKARSREDGRNGIAQRKEPRVFLR